MSCVILGIYKDCQLLLSLVLPLLPLQQSLFAVSVVKIFIFLFFPVNFLLGSLFSLVLLLLVSSSLNIFGTNAVLANRFITKLFGHPSLCLLC